MNSKLKLVPALLNWFAHNARDLPWRRTRAPYAIWVSEIMLQQTQVKTVIPYWKRWMRELPTIEAVAKSRSEKIHKLWEGLGYYTRVRNLQKAAQHIIENYGGKFPQNFDDVLALPGIGRYTAGAICSIAFNQPTPILDGNVIRVLTRVFGIAENPRAKKTNAQLWQLAEGLVEHASRFTFHVSRSKSRTRTRTMDEDEEISSCSHFNQSLMELGALVCTPRNPQCRICPVKKLCVAFLEARIGELPNLGKRETITARRFIAFVVERNGRFLVRQRSAGVINAHLWEFPNAEIGVRLSSAAATSPAHDAEKFQTALATGPLRLGQPRSAAKAAQTFGLELQSAKPFCTVKHSITRYRITLEAFRVPLGETSYTSPHPKGAKSGTRKTRPSENNGVWLPLAKLDSLAFTSAHRRILRHLQTHPQ